MQKSNMRQSHESGFTLVELAIVMLIIGLLVGGVLKGQEMIESARVSSTIQALESYDAAFNTYRDRYAGIPSDLQNPGDRIPNCTGSCASSDATPGNQQLAQDVGSAITDDGAAFWAQLSASGLIKGAAQEPDTGTFIIGEAAPEADVGGGFIVGCNDCEDTGDAGTTGIKTSQHYIFIVQDINADMGPGNAPMTAAQASQVDRKLDNGNPETGSVIAPNQAECANAPNYNTANTDTQCSVYKETIN